MKKILLVFAACFACVTMSADDFYLIDFTDGQGDWTINNVELSGLTSVWQNNSTYGMVASAFKYSTRYATESWLVSPSIDLSKAGNATLVVNQAVNKGASTSLCTKVSVNGGTTWTNLSIDMPAGNSWTFSDYEVSLDSYVGKSIQIAFVYVSSTSVSPTWEIKKVTIEGDEKVDLGDRECRYSSLNGLKKQALLNGLYEIINDHTVLDYDDCRADKAQVDLDNSGYVMDIYSNCSIYKNGYCRGTGDFASCECVNREHMLPKSWWGHDSYSPEPMYTDLHHVIPTDYEANTNRSAWIYDEVSSSTWTNGVSKLGTSKNFSGETAFEPADEYKGDVARVYFYMITCYKDKSFTQGGKGWKYFQTGTATLNNTALTLLLKWHRNDPVSQKEKDRNDKVEKKQGNRNPFVDEPSLVEHIWGNKKNTNYACTTTDVEETKQVTIHPKIMKNGRLYIQVGDQLFDVLGRNVTE